MKKLMRKLVLSSFALGLAVITLSTTTFAWYTSNTEVKANNISGASASAGADLLMISNDPAAIAEKKWNTTIDVENYNVSTTAATKAAAPNELVPVRYEALTNSATFVASFDKTVTTLSAGYIQYDLYFKMASGQTTNPRYLWLTGMTLENTTGHTTDSKVTKLPTKDVLAANEAYKHLVPSWNATSYESTYQVDIRRALLVSAVVSSSTDNGATLSNTVLKVFDPEGLNSYEDTLKNVSGFSAHEYYNAVMCSAEEHGSDKADCKCIGITEDTYSAVSLGTAADFAEQFLIELPAANTEATKNNYVKVTITIFLNGWDKACFDACQGQTISANMTFGVGTTNTGTYTPAV